jgi:hypothetical protein
MPFVRRAGDEDAAARPARRAHEVRAREQAQGLAQRRPADAELRRELLLGAEPVARRELLTDDVPPDLEGDLLARVAARLREALA